MTNYESRFTVPKDIARFFEAFQGPGNLRITPGIDTAVFEFEADDLWDARQICEDVEKDANTQGRGYDGDVSLQKPVEVTTKGGEEIKNFSVQEWAMARALYAAAHGVLLSEVNTGDKGLHEVAKSVAYLMRQQMITPHEVKVPTGVPQVNSYSGAEKSGTYWPVEAVEIILRDHGIATKES